MKQETTATTGNKKLALMFVHYKAWANELTYSSLANISSEELNKPRQTNFKTILHTLNHVYVVDDIFQAHLQHRQHGYSARNTEITPPLEALRQAVENMDKWYIELAQNLSEEELSETINFEFVGGGEGAMTRMEILLHVVNHATYHRGFVSDMMYQIPARPTANDLPVFLREVWQKG